MVLTGAPNLRHHLPNTLRKSTPLSDQRLPIQCTQDLQLNCHPRIFPAAPSSLGMEFRSLGSASPGLINPKYQQYRTSGTTAGHLASEKSVNLLCLDNLDNVASSILPENRQLVSNPSPFFASQDSRGSCLLVQDTAQPSPLLRIGKKEFPRLGASTLEQNACTKKNELPKRKHKDIQYLLSDIQFNNIARRSKF